MATSKEKMLKKPFIKRANALFWCFALVLYQCISAARIRDLFPYIISLHVPDKAQSLLSKGESQNAEAFKHLHHHSLLKGD